jgi:hypothetical protein
MAGASVLRVNLDAWIAIWRRFVIRGTKQFPRTPIRDVSRSNIYNPKLRADDGQVCDGPRAGLAKNKRCV